MNSARVGEDVFQVACTHCGAGRAVRLAPGFDAGHRHGVLRCLACRRMLDLADVGAWRDWAEAQLGRREALRKEGHLGSRKQDPHRSDLDVAYDGLLAELALCVLLCPGHVSRWLAAQEHGGPNRGSDFPSEWTGLPKPLEAKYTRYHGDATGYLLVRPPRRTPGPMSADYLDDSYYILLHGRPPRYQIDGWTDRDGLVWGGRLNPVPQSGIQRECWGIHLSRLRPVQQLAEMIG